MFADIKELKNNLEKALGKPISERKVESYTAFHVKNGQAFVRFYPRQTTLALSFKEISQEDKKRYALQDNSDRSPRHELPTKGPPFNERFFEEAFVNLLRSSYYKKVK